MPSPTLTVKQCLQELKTGKRTMKKGVSALLRHLLSKEIYPKTPENCLHDLDFMEKQYVLGRRLTRAVTATASTNRD